MNVFINSTSTPKFDKDEIVEIARKQIVTVNLLLKGSPTYIESSAKNFEEIIRCYKVLVEAIELIIDLAEDDSVKAELNAKELKSIAEYQEMYPKLTFTLSRYACMGEQYDLALKYVNIALKYNFGTSAKFLKVEILRLSDRLTSNEDDWIVGLLNNLTVSIDDVLKDTNNDLMFTTSFVFNIVLLYLLYTKNLNKTIKLLKSLIDFCDKYPGTLTERKAEYQEFFDEHFEVGPMGNFRYK